MKIERAIIVAYADNHVIGSGGEIPWMGRMPADMKHVREMTRGQAIIMGLNTFNSIGKPLPGRQNIVLTPDEITLEDAEIAHSLDEAFELVEPNRTAFIFGGASVYAQSMDLVDRIYATEIHSQFSGDTFFPEIDTIKWREVSRKRHVADDQNQFPFDFVEYERI